MVDAGVAGWNGHRYWMVATPYPNSNSAYENPSIFVSSDKTTWTVPEGLTNPIVANLGDGSYWSDPDMILVDGVMYMVYRLRTPDNLTDILYLTTSTDGINWTARVELMRGDRNAYQSPALVHDGTRFLMYYNDDADSTAVNGMYRKSAASMTGVWSSPRKMVGEKTNLSHLDVTRGSGGEYYAIFHTHLNKLYLGISFDGAWWNVGAEMITVSEDWDSWGFYRACLLRTVAGLDIWYTGKASEDDWQIGFTQVTL